MESPKPILNLSPERRQELAELRARHDLQVIAALNAAGENIPTKLINIYHKLPYDVYIGRAGKGEPGYFGNPIKLEGDRLDCLNKYREYFNKRIAEDIEFKSRIEKLRGKTLGCFCSPKMCHGMVIIEYLDGISVEQQLKGLEPPIIDMLE